MVCTKCGSGFKNVIKLTLPIISIIFSVIGIIGSWVIYYLIQNLSKSGNYSSIGIYWAFQNCFLILIFAGILIAFIMQYKQKSIMGFIAGLIPCAYLIIQQVYYFVRHIIYYISGE